MALLTAEELKASREAIKAGVQGVTDPEAEAAIAEAELIVYTLLGYSVESDALVVSGRTDGSGHLYLPERIRTATAVEEGDPATEIVATDYRVIAGGWTLQRLSGWWPRDAVVTVTGTFGYEEGDRVWEIAKTAVRKLAVYGLSATKVGSAPAAPPGAMLTGFSSEKASFTYFTPTGDLTGYADVDRLLALIKHPLNGENVMRSVPLGGRGSVL